MPFGKHRGKELSDVPQHYLVWVLDHCELKSPTLEAEIKRVLGLGPSTDSFLRPSFDDLKPIYRRLAIKYHPDRGGSIEAMVAVNEFWEEIGKSLGQPSHPDFFA